VFSNTVPVTQHHHHHHLIIIWLRVLFTKFNLSCGSPTLRHICCQVDLVVRRSVYMYIWSQFSTNCFKFLFLWRILSCNQISFPQKIFTNFTSWLVKHGFFAVQSLFATKLKRLVASASGNASLSKLRVVDLRGLRSELSLQSPFTYRQSEIAAI